MKKIPAIQIEIKKPDRQYSYVCKSIEEYNKAMRYYNKQGYNTNCKLVITQEAETLAELHMLHK